jgi:uncharacterized protein
MQLTGINIYPVKSLRGFSVTSAEVDELGLIGDRRFLVVDDNGQFLTQRALPRMAQIATELGSETLILRNPDHGSATVGLYEHGPITPVKIWNDQVQALDCGVEIAVWLSDFLRHPCRLVHVGSAYSRPVNKPGALADDQVTFADTAPLLVISEASLSNLNDRIIENQSEPVPMARFRTNLVVSGCEPFAEDTWTRLKIGEVTFRAAGLCARCIMTTTDQSSGDRGKEPLHTMATFRRDQTEPSKINFGLNLINENKTGTIRVGDAVELL